MKIKLIKIRFYHRYPYNFSQHLVTMTVLAISSYTISDGCGHFKVWYIYIIWYLYTLLTIAAARDKGRIQKHEIKDCTSVVVTGNTFITIKKFYFRSSSNTLTLFINEIYISFLLIIANSEDIFIYSVTNCFPYLVITEKVSIQRSMKSWHIQGLKKRCLCKGAEMKTCLVVWALGYVVLHIDGLV